MRLSVAYSDLATNCPEFLRIFSDFLLGVDQQLPAVGFRRSLWTHREARKSKPSSNGRFESSPLRAQPAIGEPFSEDLDALLCILLVSQNTTKSSAYRTTLWAFQVAASIR